MKAVRIHGLDGPRALVVEEIEPPAPGPGEVLLAVRAVGINFADTLMVRGLYQEKPPLPFTPGMEVAGEVIAIGPGVRRHALGDRVAAILPSGGLAERATVAEAMAVPLPDSVDFRTAAAFPIAFGTAHLALDHRAGLKSGETLLVHGAAGGVGLAAIAVGKRLGARVIATASTEEKRALARDCGADHVTGTEAGDLAARVREIARDGVDVVFDPVGGALAMASLRVMAFEGRMVAIGFASGEIPRIPANLLLVKNLSLLGLYWGAYATRRPEPFAASLTTLLGWLERGEIRPRIGAVLPLERAGEALALLADRRALGKVVVEIA